MAYHGSTPQSVLNAPSRTVERTSEPLGPTRSERRNGFTIKRPWLPQANVPFVRTTPRRGKNVRRGGLT